MVHRAAYPRRRWVHALWLIWMTLLTVGVGVIAMIMALLAGLSLLVLVTDWIVSAH